MFSESDGRTRFASRARAFENTRLIICFECAFDWKVDYVFVAFERNQSGGCEKIAPVSGSFCSILKLLRMMAFTGLL